MAAGWSAFRLGPYRRNGPTWRISGSSCVGRQNRISEVMSHFSVMSPATGQQVGEVLDAGPDEARRCADAAVAAFHSWRATTAYERAAILRRWNDLVLAHTNELARIIAEEMGKPVTEARGEVRYAATFIEWYAEEAKRVYGETLPSQAAGKRLIVNRQPVGPVYAITPWNFPAAMVTRKAAPALAAGCTLVLKPAEVSEVFLVDPRIRKLSFTGSTEVGMRLYAQSAPTMKRISLELGGQAPFLVFEDADIDAAVREVCASKFRASGQTCVCVNRIYVHESIRAAFTVRLAETVRALRMGDPLEETTQIGPLVDAAGLKKVREHVDDAVARGARVVAGGSPNGGLYFTPTVLDGVEPGSRILEEETFGPVAPVLGFRTTEEAIELANSVPWGLAAYLWTRDLTRAIRVSEALDFGIIGVNDGVPSTPQAPFGGFKYSGLGREGGKWGIDEYLEVKFLSIGLG